MIKIQPLEALAVLKNLFIINSNVFPSDHAKLNILVDFITCDHPKVVQAFESLIGEVKQLREENERLRER